MRDVRGAQDFEESEVREFDSGSGEVGTGQEDVVGLDISMHQILAM